MDEEAEMQEMGHLLCLAFDIPLQNYVPGF